MFRRWSLGLALSLALHAGTVAAVLAFALLRPLGGPVDVEMVDLRIQEVKELPLGPPPGGDRAADGRARPRVRVRAPRPPEEAGTLASRESDAKPRPGADEPEATDEGATALSSDLRDYGPEGSRLTVLLRTDRLKSTPYAAAVDELLKRLPDRRDLLEGTGLDLYDTFDALLISTPNPMDPRVTFLAARHHLSDGAMRAALDHAARATGRAISWRSEGGRPFAERRRVAGPPAPPGGRDERIIVLPTRGLVVVTPPAYRSLLLAPAPAPAPAWSTLLRRIDAQEGLLPPDAIVMIIASDLWKPKSPSPADTAVFMGMEVPRTVKATVGVDPDPFLDVTAEFAADAEAQRWEAAWPALRRKLAANPYVMITGFSMLVSRVTLSREGSLVHLRETATAEETERLLQLVTRVLDPHAGG
jgi:hypothetical protein